MKPSNRTYAFAIMAASLLALSPVAAGATDDFRYDWPTRGSFSWYTSPPEEAKNERNTWNTGDHWTSEARLDGSLSGWNEQGNYWRYNAGSKLYHNYTTGEMRYRGRPMW
ncbi:MAG: hypothetical protein HY788_17805 [Deltaproteobacteria bacterium]|nr:hypothetical protein [Deltaproteobacteria bacterium]